MTAVTQSYQRLSFSATSGIVDLFDFPCPVFLAGPGSDTLSVNDILRPYIDSDDSGACVSTVSKLESIFGVSLDPLIKDVLSTGVKASVEDIAFADSSGGMRRASLHLIPVRTGDDSRLQCAGLLIDQTESWRLSQKLNLIQSELSIISQVSSHLGSTMETEDILKIILIAVTAREGLGFNRAFVFTFDDDGDDLLGNHAIGPINAEEAGRIWGTIPDEGKDLRSIISSYLNSVQLSSTESDRRVRQVRLRVGDATLPLCDAVASRRPVRVVDEHHLAKLMESTGGLIGASNIAIAPLFSRKGVQGVIIADNLITGRRITSTDLEQLQMFASQAATALERAYLYENLQSYAERLEQVNLQLEGSQREMIRMERLSLMGEITNRIAHELRNPLTVIGGFAGLLLKTEGLSAMAVERAETIQTESRRIEKHLDVLLDFSKSYSQEIEEVDLNQLICDVARIVQPAFTKRNLTIEAITCEGDVKILTHRDLLLYGMYSVVGIAGECSVSGTHWLIQCRLEQDVKIIEAIVKEGTVTFDAAMRVMGRIASGHASTSDLRLSLANEAISFNGGILGCELRNEEPRIYIAFDNMR